MTTSATANAALLRSLERARDRQGRVPVQGTSSRAPSRSQNRTMDNASTGESISMGSNPDQQSPAPNKVDTRPAWNTSSVAHPSKTPRSVFLDAPPPDRPLPSRQINTPASTYRTPNNNDFSTPVKVVQMPPTVVEPMPVYMRNTQTSYPPNTKLTRTDPEVIMMESTQPKRGCCDCFRRKKTYRSGYPPEQEVLLNTPESPVYRACQCCARGRVASACPSCYFCELFYGCPLYCWILAFLLLLLPMLALFAWLLSEQPALNPAKRQYVTQQSSIVQNDVYAVMKNCAVPYCTNASPATTINQLYLTYHDYAVTQVTSNGNGVESCLFLILLILFHLILLH